MELNLNIEGFIGGSLLAGGGAQAFDSPDLYYDNIYTNQVILYWSQGADSYVVDISDDAGFSNIVDTYSGALTAKTFTGLSADTRYWTRCKAQFSGFADSDYTVVDFYTCPSSIVAAYLPMGVALNTENDFGAMDAADNITKLKSVIAAGPTFTRTAGSLKAINYQTDGAYTSSSISGSGYVDAPSFVNLGTGAFTFIKRFRASAPGSSSTMTVDTVAGGNNGKLLFPDLTKCRLALNGSFSTDMIFPIAWVSNTYIDFVLVCDGALMKASIDGGATWSNEVSRPGSGQAFQFNRMYANSVAGGPMTVIFEKMFCANVRLSSAQIERLLKIERTATWTNVGVDLTKNPKNIPSTFITDPINNYIESFSAGGSSRSYPRLFSTSNYDYFALDAPRTAPDYSNTTLFIRNRSTGKIYTGIDVGHLATTEDVHERPTMDLINNSIWFAQMSNHYDFSGGRLIMRKFWDNFNFAGLSTIPLGKGLGDGFVLTTTQYHQTVVTIGDVMASFSHRRDPLLSYPGRIMCALSYDGGQSWSEEFTIVNTATTNHWLYPIVIKSYGSSEVYLAIEHVILGGTPNPNPVGICVIKSSDFKTWTGIDEVTSKTVKTGELQTPLSTAEMYTMGTLIDARTLSSTQMPNAMCTETGMLYGVCGNGNNNGWDLWYQEQAASLTKKAISFSPDTVETGCTVLDTGTISNAYHKSIVAVVYKGSGKFYVVAPQKNSGNWLPTLYVTLDWGDNWAKVDVLPGIDTGYQHWKFEITANIHFNGGKGIFMCDKITDTDASTPYVLDVSEFDNI